MYTNTMNARNDSSSGRLSAGIEFVKLNRMDRYLLNEHIARLEVSLNPGQTAEESENNQNDTVWRGNRRRHYRVDLSRSELYVELDFRPVSARSYQARLLNISPSGCCILLPSGEILRDRDKIPWLRIPCGSNTLVCRASVIHVRPYET